MKKCILVGFAVLAVSTSGAFAAQKSQKPKETAAATSVSPLIIGNVSAADRALYKKNQHDSGIKK